MRRLRIGFGLAFGIFLPNFASATMQAEPIRPIVGSLNLAGQHILNHQTARIVTITKQAWVRTERSVQFESGPISCPIFTTNAIDSEKHAIRLVVFSPRLHGDLAEPISAATDLADPMKAGNYIVVGMPEINQKLWFTGTSDSEYPKTVPGTLPKVGGYATDGQPGEIAVFAMYPVAATVKPIAPGTNPLKALAESIDLKNDQSIVPITNLMVRLNHSLTPEVRENAMACHKALRKLQKGAKPEHRFRLNVAAYHMGDQDAIVGAVNAMVDLEAQNIWDVRLIRLMWFLGISNVRFPHWTFPWDLESSSAFHRSREHSLLTDCASANHTEVREFILDIMWGVKITAPWKPLAKQLLDDPTLSEKGQERLINRIGGWADIHDQLKTANSLVERREIAYEALKN